MGSDPLKEKSAFLFNQVAYSMRVWILFCSSLISPGAMLTVL